MARRNVFGVNSLRIGAWARLVTPLDQTAPVRVQPLRTGAGDEVAGTARLAESTDISIHGHFRGFRLQAEGPSRGSELPPEGGSYMKEAAES